MQFSEDSKAMRGLINESRKVLERRVEKASRTQSILSEGQSDDPKKFQKSIKEFAKRKAEFDKIVKLTDSFWKSRSDNLSFFAPVFKSSDNSNSSKSSDKIKIRLNKIDNATDKMQGAQEKIQNMFRDMEKDIQFAIKNKAK